MKWFQTVSEAPPAIVINRGRLVEDVLHKDRVRPDEILSEMSKAGIERLDMVKWECWSPMAGCRSSATTAKTPAPKSLW